MVTYRELIRPQDGLPDPFFARDGRIQPFHGDDTPNKDDAWWLARAAHLAYVQSEDAIKRCLVGTGFTFVGESSVIGLGARGTQFVLLERPGARPPPCTILAFRGTQPDEIVDVAVDVQAWPAQGTAGEWTHNGFKQAFDSIPRRYRDAFAAAAQGDLWIAGHSLGGALASIAAKEYPSARVYTYGQPHVGNEAYVRSLVNPLFVRVEDDGDLVTRVVGLLSAYRKAGRLRHLSAAGDVSQSEPPAYPPIKPIEVISDGLALTWLSAALTTEAALDQAAWTRYMDRAKHVLDRILASAAFDGAGQAQWTNLAETSLETLHQVLRPATEPARGVRAIFGLAEQVRNNVIGLAEGVVNLVGTLVQSGFPGGPEVEALAKRLMGWPPKMTDEVASSALADHAITRYADRIAATDADAWKS